MGTEDLSIFVLRNGSRGNGSGIWRVGLGTK